MRSSILQFFLLLTALPLHGQTPPPPSDLRDASSGLLAQDPFAHVAEEQEKEFTRRFNNLVKALHSFSAEYNSGQVIDVRKVKAVQKAWRQLEEAGWFRAEKPR